VPRAFQQIAARSLQMRSVFNRERKNLKSGGHVGSRAGAGSVEIVIAVGTGKMQLSAVHLYFFDRALAERDAIAAAVKRLRAVVTAGAVGFDGQISFAIRLRRNGLTSEVDRHVTVLNEISV
jgi:hypothetical protein